MDIQKINQIFADTAYIRTGGSDEELRCAEYLAGLCAAARLGHVPADFEQRKQVYQKELKNLRSGPVGDRIRAGMAISRL